MSTQPAHDDHDSPHQPQLGEPTTNDSSTTTPVDAIVHQHERVVDSVDPGSLDRGEGSAEEEGRRAASGKESRVLVDGEQGRLDVDEGEDELDGRKDLGGVPDGERLEDPRQNEPVKNDSAMISAPSTPPSLATPAFPEPHESTNDFFEGPSTRHQLIPDSYTLRLSSSVTSGGTGELRESLDHGAAEDGRVVAESSEGIEGSQSKISGINSDAVVLVESKLVDIGRIESEEVTNEREEETKGGPGDQVSPNAQEEEADVMSSNIATITSSSQSANLRPPSPRPPSVGITPPTPGLAPDFNPNTHQRRRTDSISNSISQLPIPLPRKLLSFRNRPSPVVPSVSPVDSQGILSLQHSSTLSLPRGTSPALTGGIPLDAAPNGNPASTTPTTKSSDAKRASNMFFDFVALTSNLGRRRSRSSISSVNSESYQGSVAMRRDSSKGTSHSFSVLEEAPKEDEYSEGEIEDEEDMFRPGIPNAVHPSRVNIVKSGSVSSGKYEGDRPGEVKSVIPSFPAAKLGLSSHQSLSTTCHKHFPFAPTTSFLRPSRKEWRTRHILLTVGTTLDTPPPTLASHLIAAAENPTLFVPDPTKPIQSTLHLFKSNSPSEFETERLRITCDSIVCIPSEEYLGKGKKRSWCLKVTGMGLSKEESNLGEVLGLSSSSVERESNWVVSFESVAVLKEWLGRLKEIARSLRAEPPSPSHFRPRTPPDPQLSPALRSTPTHHLLEPTLLIQHSQPNPSPTNSPSLKRRLSNTANSTSPQMFDSIQEPSASSPTSRRSSMFLSSGSTKARDSYYASTPPIILSNSPPVSPTWSAKGKALLRRSSSRATSSSPPSNDWSMVGRPNGGVSENELGLGASGGLGEAIDLSQDWKSTEKSGSYRRVAGFGADERPSMMHSLPTPPRGRPRVAPLFEEAPQPRPRLLSGGLGEAAFAEIHQVMGTSTAVVISDENRTEPHEELEEDEEDELVSLHPYRQAGSPRRIRVAVGSPRIPDALGSPSSKAPSGSPPTTPTSTSTPRRGSLLPFHDGNRLRDSDASSQSSYASSSQHYLLLPPRAPPPTGPLPETPSFGPIPLGAVRPISQSTVATTSSTSSSSFASKRMSNLSTGSSNSSMRKPKTRVSSPPLLPPPSGSIPPPPSAGFVPSQGIHSLRRLPSAASTYSHASGSSNARKELTTTQRDPTQSKSNSVPSSPIQPPAIISSATPPPSTFELPLPRFPPPAVPLPPTPPSTFPSVPPKSPARRQDVTASLGRRGVVCKLELEEMGGNRVA